MSLFPKAWQYIEEDEGKIAVRYNYSSFYTTGQMSSRLSFFDIKKRRDHWYLLYYDQYGMRIQICTQAGAQKGLRPFERIFRPKTYCQFV